MEKTLKTALFSCILISIFISSSAQTCSSHQFTGNLLFSRCNDLPVLNSFIHWNYHQSNSTVDIAYRHTRFDPATQWVAWALNLDGPRMVGSQSLVAFQNSSGVVHAYTAPVDSYGTTLAEGGLTFSVSRIQAESSNNEVIIFATLQLPGDRTTFNQLWQVGPLNGGTPSSHATTGENVRSIASLNFLQEANGTTTVAGGSNSIQRRRNVHGVLNAISWGTLMPLGAIIARYLRVFKSADPAWFYLHVACQTAAYSIGVAGWATGLKLGSDSIGIKHETHGNIGIALFCLGTLQVFALLLRPKKDHKFRLYWNIYHHLTGYTVIIMSIVNVFKGLKILSPDDKWEKVYIAILIFLGFNAALLEAFTWYIVIKRKKAGSDKHPHGANGTNGYGAQQTV